MIAMFIISIDIEDWPQSTWDHNLPITERAARNTLYLLDILAVHKRTITMFVLGKFAERFPDVVRRIANDGHEVAAHGYGHIEVFKQTPSEFSEDIRRSKALLEDITGKPVRGYRAPDYSITSDTLWALEILSELGFVYDSSIFPSSLSRYGIAEWPTHPALVRLTSGRTILEFPLSTIRFLNQDWPVAGGGYHRLLPWPIIKYLIGHQLKRGKSFMTYCHPYEFDPNELKELDFGIPLKTRLHQGHGRKGFRYKFERLLDTFDNMHAAKAVVQENWPDYDISALVKGKDR